MLRNLLCLCFNLAISASIIAQIGNADFESFSEHEAYEDLIGVLTSNNQDHILGFATSVNRVDGLDGSAARLTGQVLFGSFFFPGIVGTQNLLLGGQERMAYSEQPDSVYVVVRYDIAFGDSASVLFDFYGNNESVNRKEIILAGQSDQFIELGFDFENFTSSTNELFWTVTSSNLANANLDSWVEIDEIRFTGVTEQLPNNLFNDWELKTWIDPDGWESSNQLTGPIVGIHSISQTSDSQSGSSAVSIISAPTSVINYIGTDAALVTNGSLRSLVDGGMGIAIEGGVGTGTSNAIIGYFKFAPIEDERAAIRVQLKSTSNEVLSDELMNLPSSSDYQEFTYVFPVEADIVVITFISGVDSETGNYSVVGGSELIVDNLSLSVVTSTIGDFGDNQISFKAFVNNDTHQLQLEINEIVENGKLALYNIEGQRMFEEKISKVNSYTKSLSHLSPGIYVLHLASQKKRGSIKLYID